MADRTRRRLDGAAAIRSSGRSSGHATTEALALLAPTCSSSTARRLRRRSRHLGAVLKRHLEGKVQILADSGCLTSVVDYSPSIRAFVQREAQETCERGTGWVETTPNPSGGLAVTSMIPCPAVSENGGILRGCATDCGPRLPELLSRNAEFALSDRIRLLRVRVVNRRARAHVGRYARPGRHLATGARQC